ncbi:listerin E3 ubiquitin protein ligase 1, partial [Ceratobasidium sp. 395]
MGKQGKSSATSGTRKKHQKKAAALDPSISIAPAAKSQGKGGKKKNKEPRVKQYIPPPKFKPLVDDPIDKLATTGLLPPNMVLSFRGLSKKDPVTKTKALEELSEMLGDDSWPAALPVWLWHFVSLSVHPSRRIRELNATIHSKLVSKPELRDELQTFFLSRSEAGTLLAAWFLGANDVVIPIATSLRSSWDSTVLWRQGTDQTGLLDIQDRLDDLVSSVIQAVVEPEALYQEFAPLAAATKDSTDKADALNAHEQSRDRDARIRTSGLEAPQAILLPQLIPTLTDILSSNPLIGTVLSPHEFPQFLTGQTAASDSHSFGYGQRGVRISGWNFVKSIVKYLQRQSPPPQPAFQPVFLSSLGMAALQSAWIEPDAGVRTLMWDGLLTLITKYPEVWSIRAIAPQGQDDDETSDSEGEGEGEDLAPTPTPTETQSVLPGQSAYLDFLNFLQLGCLGSGVQSYPAVVIVLSTLPSTILPYNEDDLERFFDSFWAAVDGNALSVLPRDREPVLKSYLSTFLECVVFVCQRLKQTLESNADATTPGLLETIMNTRIGQVIKELVQGGIMDSLSANTAGTLLGGSIKKLEQIAPEIIDRAWMSTWKFALLDTQDQTPQLRNSARLLTSMLGPLEDSALSTSNIHQLIVEMVHLDYTGTTDPGIATRQGQVLGILWEHKTFSDTTWLAEVTRNALRGGLMQHLISANNSHDIGTLLTGLLAVPSVSVELGMDIWSDFLRLSVQESAYRLLRDVLGLVQFSPLQPVQQPELYQACIAWVGEIVEGNSEHLPELSSVLSRWEMCLSRSQLHELLAPLVDSFIREGEELVFSTDYSQSRPGLEGSTRILLSVIHHLEAQTLMDDGGFDLARLGALLHILPALSLHLPPELGGLLSQLELGRKKWQLLTTSDIHADAERKGQVLVGQLLSSCITPLRHAYSAYKSFDF